VPNVPVVVPTTAGPVAPATADETALAADETLLDAADATELAASLTLLPAADAAELTATAAELAVDEVDDEPQAVANNPTASTAPTSRPVADQRLRAPSMATPFGSAHADLRHELLSPLICTTCWVGRFS